MRAKRSERFIYRERKGREREGERGDTDMQANKETNKQKRKAEENCHLRSVLNFKELDPQEARASVYLISHEIRKCPSSIFYSAQRFAL